MDLYRLLRYQVLPILIMAALITFVLFPISLLCLPLPRPIRPRYIGPAWRWMANFWVISVAKMDFYMADYRQNKHWPVPHAGLYICNHLSFIDIVIFPLKHFVQPLMKAEILFVPIFGLVAYAAGSISVRRGDASSRKAALLECIKRLKNRQAVLYYPEGTRSKLGTPKPFHEIKTTLMSECYKNNIPVIPLSVWGTDQVMGPWFAIRPHAKVGFITHEALWPKDFSSEQVFLETCWEKVLDGTRECAEHFG